MENLDIWGKVKEGEITLQIKGKNFETQEVTIPLKAIAPVMTRLTRNLTNQE
jgi:hypothetical protein